MARKNFKIIEYQNKNIKWLIFPEVCKSCGLCVEKCPQKCLSYDLTNNEYLGNPAVKCNVDKCITCQICEGACPDGAIKVGKGI